MVELALVLIAIAAIAGLWLGFSRTLDKRDVMDEEWLAPGDPRLARYQGGQDGR